MSRSASVRRLATFAIAMVVAASPVPAVFGETLSGLHENGVGWSRTEADAVFYQAVDSGSVELMERAVNAYRAAEGPFTLSQLPAMQHLLQYRLQKQEWQQLRQDLSTAMGIYTAHYEPDDPIFIQVAQVRAHWHLLAYFNGIKFNGSTDLSIVLPELESAYRLTTRALELASDNYGAAYSDLPEMLRDMAAMSWLFARHHQTGDTRAGRVQVSHSGSHRLNRSDAVDDRYGYRQGRQALESVVDLIERNPQHNAEQLAQAWLDLSDWHRDFGYQQRAERAYQQAEQSASNLDNHQQAGLFSRTDAPDPLRWLNAGLATNLVFPAAKL